MRLIDVDKLIMYVADCKLSESITWEVAELITDFLRNAPIIESRPKGKWEEATMNFANNKYINAIFGQGYYCSNCGMYMPNTKTNFCANCGADMRGKE